tara:strand:- start:354 stop:659 length:306 start_codon:yes stop_codon:yes gene_type:complete
MIALLALSGQFKVLAVMASGSILLVYAGVCLSTLKLRMRDGAPSEGQFKMPGKAIIPLLSCCVITSMLLQLTGEEALGLLTLMGISSLIFVVQKVIDKKRI